MMLCYKVIFVYGSATNNEDKHNATLGNMLAMFAEVMSTREVVERLAKATIKPLATVGRDSLCLYRSPENSTQQDISCTSSRSLRLRSIAPLPIGAWRILSTS
jgi:hypothetical protein